MDCNHSKEETVDYLGEVQLTFLMNSVSFNQLEFGNGTLTYNSVFKNVQFDENKPNFVHAELQMAEVHDQYKLLQLGDETIYKYYLWGKTPT